jgi:formyl-CoA transferase
MSDTALAGVRVLDVATLFPAPMLAAMLGDFGADVVKVEPRGGDPLRAIGAVPWAIAGRNKRSVLVDFDTTEGLELLHGLIDVADVVVLNQPRVVLERWGATDEEIAARNPRAIVVHVTAFGSTGPYADRVGNGSLAEAFIGLPISSVPLGDTIGAITGVVDVLAALYSRDTTTGRGQVVDVSLYEALLPLLAPALAGSSTPRSVRDTVDAADGRAVMVAATTDAQIERLRALTGDNVAQWIARRTADDAVAELVDVRVPAVVVNDLAQLRTDPQVVARHSIVDWAPAPGLGDHTAEVVAEWLHGGAT